jgi:DNA-binding transcriptional regulator YhcF (GntR family)
LNGILNDQRLIYRQIAKLVEDGILNGEYPEEGQVPSTTELARVFAINPATAAKGVNQLVDEGLLYKRRGIGMFVAPGAAEALRRKRQAIFAQEKVTALVREAKNLGLSRAELLEQVEAAAAREGLTQEG